MSGERESPLPMRGIESKLRAWARRKDVQPERLRKTLIVLVVSQMVPEDTVIKGGNSLALTYPLAQTRFSKDLDLVATEGFESWKKTFVRNLEKRAFLSRDRTAISHHRAEAVARAVP
jgi:predicted nucleotidyltransferase component of viral defense system